MSSLKLYVNNIRKHNLFLAFSNLQRAYTIMDKNRLSFLQNGDERKHVVYQKGYADSQRILSGLKKELEGTPQEENIGDLIFAFREYNEGVEQIHANYTKMRNIILSELEPLGASIILDAGMIRDEVEASLTKRNVFSLRLVIITLITLAFATIATVLIGIRQARKIVRNITEPLEHVMKTSRHAADRDIESLKNQLSNLSRGDTVIAFSLSTKPLTIEMEDEIGKTGKAFNEILEKLKETEIAFGEMASYLKEMTHASERVASRDLEVSVTPHSDEDVLGKAIQGMITNLKQYRHEIDTQLNRLGVLRIVFHSGCFFGESHKRT